MKERLLGLVFTLQELNVIDQQDVDLAVFSLEGGGSVVLNRVDEVVGEFFGRYIANFDSRVKAKRVVADRVQKVSLAQTRVSVDKQRVVSLGRGLGHGKCRGVRESVRSTGHERVKCVLWV